MVMYSRMIMHGPDLRCSYICSTKELLFASDYLDTHTHSLKPKLGNMPLPSMDDILFKVCL